MNLSYLLLALLTVTGFAQEPEANDLPEPSNDAPIKLEKKKQVSGLRGQQKEVRELSNEIVQLSGSDRRCASGMIKFHLELETDNYGQETSWKVIRNSDNQYMAGFSGLPSNRDFDISFCLPQESYTFTIMDSFGDGICCKYGRGRAKLFIDDELEMTAGNFGYSKSHRFGTSFPPPCQLVTLKLLTDEYPRQTRVSLTNTQSGVAFWEDARFTRPHYRYTKRACINPTICHEFEITDMHNDGICHGYVELEYQGQTVFTASCFGTRRVHRLGNCD